MPTTFAQPYFLDGNTLIDSTSVYLNSALSVFAPDGWYSDGSNIRELSGGVLQPVQPCPACGVSCGGQINGSGGTGEYILQIDTGSLSSSTGAIVVTFDPFSVPDGIIAELDGVFYNQVSSPTYGYLAGTPDLPIFLGRSASDCGISGSTRTLNTFLWNGTAFVATGSTDTITIAAGQMQLTTNGPGPCIMVVPKINPTPSLLTVKCYGVCGSTAFNVKVSCPSKIKSINSSIRFDSSSDPALCSASLGNKLYPVRVTGVSPYLGLNDWIFGDEFGSVVVPDGFYRTNNLNAPYDTIEVQTGLVVDILNLCP
jgi:hypothetical protein